MATISSKCLFRGAVPTALTTEYTVPGSTTTFLKSFDICNTTSAPITIRLYIVPNGQAAGVSYALLYDFQIPANTNGIFGWEGENVMGTTGDTVQMIAAGAGLAIHMSGVEVS